MASPVKVASAPVSIVIADDHAMVRSGLRVLLDSEPDLNVVAEAGDVSTALECARRHRPAVVVLDLNMPDIGGVEVLEFVRGQDKLRTLPIIIVTTRGDDSSRTQALAAGATRYVTKPFTPESILTEVNSLLPGAQAQASG